MRATYTLEEVEFEWDSDKAEANIDKHGVSFPEACEVFFDPFVYAVEPEEVDGELREAAIGLTRRWRLLQVAFLWRKLTLRLVSARQATKTERKFYENQ
jgi:uncharacterized DUF497 family protein